MSDPTTPAKPTSAALVLRQDEVQPELGSMFAGFDDWMEAKEPGYTAARAAEKLKRARDRESRVAGLIARYGSEEAVLAPCPREQLLLAAVKPWHVASDPPWQRWTWELVGWEGVWIEKMPEPLRTALATAYPLPTTFQEAKAEHDYWLRRRSEMEDVLGEFGDDGLDLVARARALIVRELVEHELPTLSLADLYQRFAMKVESEADDPKMERALFRDLGMLVRADDTTPAGNPALEKGEGDGK